MQQAGLLRLEKEDVTSTNSDIIAAAVQQGISPKEMAQNVRDAKTKQAQGTIGLTSEKMKMLRGYLGGRNPNSLLENGGQELRQLQKTNPEVYQAFQEFNQRTGIMSNKGESDSARQADRARMLEESSNAPGQTNASGRAKSILETGTAGKKGEEMIAAQAAQEKQMVLNLKALESQLMPTAKGIEELTKRIIQLGNAAHILEKNELGQALSNNPILQPVSTKQSMGTTPSNGSKP